jgi:thiamine transporter ThiT
MTIQAVLIGGFETGVGVVTAVGYKASWEQAVLFSSVNGIVSGILACLIESYLQNSRQLVLAHIAIQATAGLAGVLMTRLICERTIDWKPALASFVISDTAVGYVCTTFMKPVPLQSFFEMI